MEDAIRKAPVRAETERSSLDSEPATESDVRGRKALELVHEVKVAALEGRLATVEVEAEQRRKEECQACEATQERAASRVQREDLARRAGRESEELARRSERLEAGLTAARTEVLQSKGEVLAARADSSAASARASRQATLLGEVESEKASLADELNTARGELTEVNLGA